jgi:hypothetical protein
VKEQEERRGEGLLHVFDFPASTKAVVQTWLLTIYFIT